MVDWNNPHSVQAEVDRLIRLWKKKTEVRTYTFRKIWWIE